MDQNEFNESCAKYMGYEIVDPPSFPTGEYFPIGVYVANQGSGRWNYNPYDDLNQMAEVVDKAKKDMEQLAFADFLDNIVRCDSIKQALRDFITECLNP